MSRWIKNTVLLLLLATLIYVVAKILLDSRDELTPFERLQSTLMSGPSCYAPCWRNITPGESSEDDFLALVDSSPSDRFRRLKRSDVANARSGSGYSWTDRQLSANVRLLAPLSAVTQLDFGWALDDAPSIGSVLELLGAPDAYTAEAIGGESEDLAIALLYERGVVVDIWAPIPGGVTLSTMKQCEFDLTEDIPIFFLYYVKPNRSTVLARRMTGLGLFEVPQTWAGLEPLVLTTRECRGS